MSQISDDLFLGAAPTGMGLDASLGNPSPMGVGVGPMGRVYIFDIVPTAASNTNLAALQTTAGAGNLTLTAGTGVTLTTGQDGIARYTLDTPRSLALTSTGDLSGITFTVSGYDLYGQLMTQAMAGPNNNTVTTLKAFKSVVSVAVSAAVGTNVSVGGGSIFGLPVRVTNAGYVLSVKWASALADDAGTFVVAVTTDPSTALLGDVRGTYATSSPANGSRRLVVAIAIPAIGSGPNATRLGALGVTQV